MSEYKEIKGKSINFLAADPDNVEAEGQVWYNSTDGVFKNVIVGEAWSSGANMSTARRLMASSSSGPQTAALGVGGYIDGTGDTAVTEEYNGSGFSTGTSINTARREFDGAGTQTSTLVFGGRIGPVQQNAQTEEFNGSSWSEQNDLNTGRQRLSGAGVQTAALAFAGITDGDATEEYNGTSWTAANNMGSGTYGQGGSGTQTAALSCGGNPYRTTTEEYDGTNWTTVNSLNTGRMFLRASGTQTTTLAFGGKTPPSSFSTASESYDGTTWTNTSSLANAVAEQGRGGGNSAAVSFGGFAPPSTSRTEEFNRSTNVITAAAWSSANAPSSPVYGGATGGTPTAAFLAAGFGTGAEPATQKTFNQHYDGTSWTEEGDLNTARFYVGGAGTQTASLVFGGRIVPSPSYNNNSEEYNGSSWTAGNTIGTARQFGGSNGTQTAALAIGGNSATNAVEEYDGTDWASGTVYPTSNTSNAVRSVGPQTAAFAVGGSPATTNTNFYDGSTWTAGPSLNSTTGEGNMSGSQTVAIKTGGNFGGSSYTTRSERYDGTSWATSANLGTGRSAMPSGPSGDFSSTTALCFGGPIGAPTFEANQLEEFTGETSALNIKTLTTS